MESASAKEIKVALTNLEKDELIAMCLRLSSFKKENKELLGYLLFDQSDEDAYVQKVKEFLEEEFSGINTSAPYLVRKSLRRIIRLANRYAKYSKQKSTAVELHLFIVERMKKFPVKMHSSATLAKILQSEKEKLKKMIAGLQ